MTIRGVFAAIAAIVLSATLVETAQAYPLLARSGTTTVTGTYRPLDLDLQVVDGQGQWLYDPSRPADQRYGLTATLGGTFRSSVGTDYDAFGDAGSWTLHLGYTPFNIANSTVTGYGTLLQDTDPILDNRVTTTVSGNTITLRVTASDRPVGSLVYKEGLMADLLGGSDALPAGDTPRDGDMFLLFAHNAGAVLVVTETYNGEGPADDDFLLQFAGNNFLEHLGPYIQVGGVESNLYALDDGNLAGRGVSRVNDACIPLGQGRPGCGSVPNDSFFVSSVPGATQPDPIYVPEPASLALVGLGLLGIAFGQQRRKSRLRSA